MIQASEQAKHVGDAVSIAGLIATIVGWLPALAALFSIIWSVIRIYETRTVQKWIAKFYGAKK